MSTEGEGKRNIVVELEWGFEWEYEVSEDASVFVGFVRDKGASKW